MRAAVKATIALDPVTDDATTAMSAYRCQFLNCALKAVEGIAPSVHDYVKTLIVVVVTR